MARHVKIATLAPPVITPKTKTADAVAFMRQHWQACADCVLPEKPDLILLPEVCDHYPCKTNEEQDAYYRQRGNTILNLWVDIARRNRCNVAYSAFREDKGKWYNSIQMIDRSGNIIGIYNKMHPTIGAVEKNHNQYGDGAVVIKCDFGTVGGVLCFDLNFDDLRLQYVNLRPDLLLFSSWFHGGFLQNCWAYSCRAHFVSAVAGSPSVIMTPVGTTIAATTNYRWYAVGTVNLDCCLAHYDFNRNHFTDMKHKYGDGVQIHDPGWLGSVLITNELPDMTIDDLCREFGIEKLDDYFARCRQHRQDHYKPTQRI